MASINNYLRDKASEYFISYGSTERDKINSSISNLKTKIYNDLGVRIITVEEFGSFKRGTILPRSYDYKSDVDILIIFDHAELQYQPSTYRRYLKDFAEKNFTRSVIYKDSPTVVLELSHIKYDLVPCYTDESWLWGKRYFIPENDSKWMVSDIHGFNEKLSKANSSYSNIVKPIIRLLKAWNAKVCYPLNSYELEQEIANLCFSRDNYESGFFYAIERLNSNKYSQNVNAKIDALKANAKRVKNNLDTNINVAHKWLEHILP